MAANNTNTNTQEKQSKNKFNGGNPTFKAELVKYTEHYCTLDEVREKLARDGVAVVRGVLTPDELTRARARDLKWKMMHELSAGRMTPTNPQSWGFLYDLYPLHSMLIQHWG